MTRLARKVLEERRLNQIQQLPLPQDLEKLSQHLQKKLTESDLDEKMQPGMRIKMPSDTHSPG